MKIDPTPIRDKIVYVGWYQKSDKGGQSSAESFIAKFNNTTMVKLSKGMGMTRLYGDEHGTLVPVNEFLFYSKETERYWEQRDIFANPSGETIFETRIDAVSIENALNLFCEASTQYVLFEEAFPGMEIVPA